MRFVHVLLHEGRTEERIVDMRVDCIAVMQVDAVRSGFSYYVYRLISMRITLFQFFGRLVTVIVAIGPLLHGVYRFERCHQHQEVEIQFFSFGHGPLSAVGFDIHLFLLFPVADTSFAVVEPGWRHVQRLHFVEIGVQRAAVVFRTEQALHSTVYVAEPETFLIAFHIPFPSVAFRTQRNDIWQSLPAWKSSELCHLPMCFRLLLL